MGGGGYSGIQVVFDPWLNIAGLGPAISLPRRPLLGAFLSILQKSRVSNYSENYNEFDDVIYALNLGRGGYVDSEGRFP